MNELMIKIFNLCLYPFKSGNIISNMIYGILIVISLFSIVYKLMRGNK